MLRRLLTCLMLITGLAATGAPVNAAMLSGPSGQVMASAPEMASAQGHEIKGFVAIVHTVRVGDRDGNALTFAAGSFAPTVHLRIDRARE